MIQLSVIILSYNTKTITKQCITALIDCLNSISPALKYELIVVDNGSTDGSVQEIRKLKVKIIANKENFGFTKGNNQAIKKVSGQYVLFLNSDVICRKVNFHELLNYFEVNARVGALTVDVRLENGHMDPACHRGFPTVWNAFTYFLGLEKLGGVFGGYHMIGQNLTKIHKIGSGSGAFYLTRKSLLDRLQGFDESFFMYGEDLDLSYRIMQLGYDFIFYPRYKVLHLKHQSGFRKSPFFEAMTVFYRKHYALHNHFLLNWLVYLFIDLRKKLS